MIQDFKSSKQEQQYLNLFCSLSENLQGCEMTPVLQDLLRERAKGRRVSATITEASQRSSNLMSVSGKLKKIIFTQETM